MKMSLLLVCVMCVLLRSWTATLRLATIDEVAQCGLSGIYKARQSVLKSPNYPDYYPASTCWDYVVRSPYNCPTKFHVQFLHFKVEASLNCTNDYLAIGLASGGIDETMDLLCGQVVGIKKYHTVDGILRLRFRSDDSPWSTAQGFKLLVTRLACERENLVTTTAAGPGFTVPVEDFLLQQAHPAPPFHNASKQEQHVSQPFPWHTYTPPTTNTTLHPGLYLPAYSFSVDGQKRILLPPRAPTAGHPFSTNEIADLSPFYINTYNNYQQLPQLTDQYSALGWNPPPPVYSSSETDLLTAQPFGCCSAFFLRKRFYLSSPGFPHTAFAALSPTHQRDCYFQLEKATQQVCRLRIDFKFFNFGHSYGASDTSCCIEDFVEIDGERYCGCRTGFVHTVLWPLGNKLLRMRLGYSSLPSQGFLLDILQEECEHVSLSRIQDTFPYQQPLNEPHQSIYQRVLQYLPPLTELSKNQLTRRSRNFIANSWQQPYSDVAMNENADAVSAQLHALSLKANNLQTSFSIDSGLSSGRCIFNLADTVRLTVDTLWQMKPICFAPQHTLFNNN